MPPPCPQGMPPPLHQFYSRFVDARHAVRCMLSLRLFDCRQRRLHSLSFKFLVSCFLPCALGSKFFSGGQRQRQRKFEKLFASTLAHSNNKNSILNRKENVRFLNMYFFITLRQLQLFTILVILLKSRRGWRWQ